MNNENVIENKVCFSDNNIFKENIFPKNNYIEKKIIKSRNIKNNSGNNENNYKKNKTSDDKINKRNNKFIFRTAGNIMEHNPKNKSNEEITILPKKYISFSCGKKNRPKTLQFLIPLKILKLKNKSACKLKKVPNLNVQKNSKNFLYNNLSPKKISSFEMKGNMEIINTSEIIKISNCSGDNDFEKINTNINSVLNSNIENNIQNLIYQVESTRMKTETKFMKNNQLDSIVEEINEEENDIKRKSKNNCDKVICDNSFSGKKYNSYFSYDIDIKNNMAINSTGISSKFSTGKLTNNIFDIPSDDDNNINYRK